MSTSTATAFQFEAVAPNDSTDMPNQARALYVGGNGNIAVQNNKGVAVSFIGVVAGTILPVQTARVLATGTTATDLISLF